MRSPDGVSLSSRETAGVGSAGAEIDNPIGRLHELQIVIDYDE